MYKFPTLSLEVLGVCLGVCVCEKKKPIKNFKLKFFPCLFFMFLFVFIHNMIFWRFQQQSFFLSFFLLSFFLPLSIQL